MKRILVCLFLLVLTTLPSSASWIKNTPNGFRGIEWKEPPSSLGSTALMIDEDQENEIKVYKKTDERLFLGAARLSGVSYVFWRDRFFMVLIKGESESDFADMKAVSIERFADPMQPNRHTEEFIWFDAIVSIRLLKSPSPLLVISYNKIDEERANARLEKNKRGTLADF